MIKKLLSWLSVAQNAKNPPCTPQENAAKALVAGFRGIATCHHCSPSAAMSDATILDIYKRVLSGFRAASEQREERLPAEIINRIALHFMTMHEELGAALVDFQLPYEVEKYRREGLRADYKVPVSLLPPEIQQRRNAGTKKQPKDSPADFLFAESKKFFEKEFAEVFQRSPMSRCDVWAEWHAMHIGIMSAIHGSLTRNGKLSESTGEIATMLHRYDVLAQRDTQRTQPLEAMASHYSKAFFQKYENSMAPVIATEFLRRCDLLLSGAQLLIKMNVAVIAITKVLEEYMLTTFGNRR